MQQTRGGKPRRATKDEPEEEVGRVPFDPRADTPAMPSDGSFQGTADSSASVPIAETCQRDRCVPLVPKVKSSNLCGINLQFWTASPQLRNFKQHQLFDMTWPFVFLS